MADACILWTDLDGRPWQWDTPVDLARAYWAEQPLHQAAGLPDTPALDCVHDLTHAGRPEALAVIRCLTDQAAGEYELCLVGAGPLEDLLSHAGHGSEFVEAVEGLARDDARFRQALKCVWLGEDVAPEVRERLSALGADDLVAGREEAERSRRARRPSKRQRKRPRDS